MYTSHEIINKVKISINEKLNYNIEGNVAPETKLGVDGLELDSLSIIELIVQLEDDFGIIIPEDDIEEFNSYTLSELAEYIKSRLKL
jgi:acyl carrier protein